LHTYTVYHHHSWQRRAPRVLSDRAIIGLHNVQAGGTDENVLVNPRLTPYERTYIHA